MPRFQHVVVNFDTRSIRLTENSREAYVAAQGGMTVVTLPLPDTPMTEQAPKPQAPPPGQRPRVVIDNAALGNSLDKPLDWSK